MVMLRSIVVPALAAAAIFAGAATDAASQAFASLDGIETRLVRGISTGHDVVALLGRPNGSGSAVFPPDHRPRKVWYYEDIEVTDIRSDDDGLRLNVRQQILLIFLDGDRYDGFTWSSNVLPGTGR